MKTKQPPKQPTKVSGVAPSDRTQAERTAKNKAKRIAKAEKQKLAVVQENNTFLISGSKVYDKHVDHGFTRRQKRAMARIEAAKQQEKQAFLKRMATGKEVKKVQKIFEERGVKVTHLPSEESMAAVARWKAAQEKRHINRTTR